MKHLRRLGTLAVFVVAASGAMAVASSPAHAESCSGTLVVSLSGCVRVGGVTVTATKPEPQQPGGSQPDTGAIARTIAPPTRPPAPPKPRAAHVAPKFQSSGVPSTPRRVDVDSFTTGSFDPDLPVNAWAWEHSIGAGSQAAPAKIFRYGASDLLTPLRVATMYAGLFLIAAAIGVRKLLVAF